MSNDQSQGTEQSAYQVATKMAAFILYDLEKKEWDTIDRKEYLDTVAECVLALKAPLRRGV